MDLKQLPGSLKAAILIKAMGGEFSREILARLDASERRVIEEGLSQLDSVSPNVLEKVAKEFMASIERPSPGREARRDRSLKTEDSGDKESSDIKSLEILQSKDPEELVTLIKDEHPQTIAFILVHIPAERACQVLMKLPDPVKSEIAYRIATSSKFSSEMMEEMKLAFDDILKKERVSVVVENGGIQRLAEIFNIMDNTVAQKIMNDLESENPDFVAQLKQMMFVFDDITLVDDRGFQQVLRRVDSKELAISLKAASEAIREKVFRNMSSRAGDMLREEMESLGPVRMRDVEESQQKILNIILEMEAAGELVIQRGGGDEFVE